MILVAFQKTPILFLKTTHGSDSGADNLISRIYFRKIIIDTQTSKVIGPVSTVKGFLGV